MWRGVHGVRRKIASAEMSSLKEQRCSVKFCVKLGKSFMETFELITKAYGEDAMKCTVFYEWFTRFKKGWQSAEDDEHSGGPSMLIDDSLHWESERSRSCKSTLDCQGICRRVWHLDWFMLWNPNWKIEDALSRHQICASPDDSRPETTIEFKSVRNCLIELKRM